MRACSSCGNKKRHNTSLLSLFRSSFLFFPLILKTYQGWRDHCNKSFAYMSPPPPPPPLVVLSLPPIDNTTANSDKHTHTRREREKNAIGRNAKETMAVATTVAVAAQPFSLLLFRTNKQLPLPPLTVPKLFEFAAR